MWHMFYALDMKAHVLCSRHEIKFKAMQRIAEDHGIDFHSIGPLQGIYLNYVIHLLFVWIFPFCLQFNTTK